MSKLQQAEDAFRATVDYELNNYVGTPFDNRVTLDGEFTVEELEVVVAAFKKYHADKA